MGLADLVTAALVGLAVWRLSGRRRVAVVAAAMAPLLPIALNQHAQLTPETLAAPLLLAGALCSARPRSATAGGLLLALAVLSKVAFVIPALAIALAAASRRKTLAALLAGGIVLTGLSLVIFGTGVWRQAVQAQLQVGRATLHSASGLLAQGAWSELVLVVGAASALVIGLRNAEVVVEPALLRTLAASAGAGLLLVLTVFKRGSYINVLVVAEPSLLVLAACGAASSWHRRRRSRPLLVALGALLALQSLSLLVSPGNPWLAKRPGARSGLDWTASPSTVDAEVSLARRCSKRLAYSGDPYVAFLARRRMPGDQPDLFMLENAPVDSRFANRAIKDRPRCP
jgi:hypothetical protein